MKLLRPAVALVGFGALAFASNPQSPLLLVGAAIGVLGLLAVAWSDRPWALGLAWLGAVGALAGAGTPANPTLQQLLLAGVAVATISASTFLPTLSRRQVGLRQLVAWTCTPAVAMAIAWAPSLASRDNALATMEPLTPAGAVIRLLVAAGLLALLAMVRLVVFPDRIARASPGASQSESP